MLLKLTFQKMLVAGRQRRSVRRRLARSAGGARSIPAAIEQLEDRTLLSAIALTETGGETVVSENSSPDRPIPETDTFTAVLTGPPAAGTVVVLDVTSSDTGKATVSPSQLTFDSSNWDQPQSITVQGVNDNAVAGNSGNPPVPVTVAVNDGLTTDDSFDAAANQAVLVTVLDVPVAPTMLGPLTGQTVADGQVTFTWNDVEGATSYNIWLLDLADPADVLFFKFDIAPGGTFTLPAADALDAPGDYRYFFSANNANGFSNWSGPHDFSVGAAATVPVPPTGFSISTSGNPQQPTIEWPDVPGATFYNVWLVNLDTGTLAESATGLPTSSFTTSVLDPGLYRLFANAGNAAGTSGWSAPFDFDVGTAVGFAISETGGGTVVSENSSPDRPIPETDTFGVVLTSPPDAGTVVVLDVGSSDTGEATVNPAQLTFDASNWDQPQVVTVQGINDNLAEDLPVQVDVTVSVNGGLTTDDDFDSLADQVVSVSVLNVPVTPTMLSPLTGQVVADGQVTFTWNDVEGATSYNIWLLDLADPADVLFFKFDIAPGGTFTLPAADALDAPGDYRYFFSANNDNGFSNWSGPHDFSVGAAATVPVPPTGFSISTSGNPQQPTIEWPDVPGATFYNVWLVNLDTGTLAESATGLPTSSFTTSVLDPGLYRLFANAGNAAGTSGWSAPFDFDVGTAVGFAISETGGGTVVSENSSPDRPIPETDTFGVVLTSPPDAGTVVVLDVGSSDTGEATVNPAQLTFDASNWDQPQVVTVQGINDNLAEDLPVQVDVTVSVNGGLTTDDDFDSLADQVVSVSVLNVPVTPTMLSPLTGQVVADGQVTFTWDDVEGATSYNIWLLDLADPADVLFFKFDIAPGGTFTLPAADALDAPGDYRYFFSANNANGFSNWSGPHDFSVGAAATVPAAPNGLAATDTDTLRPTIQWNASAGATHYAIWFINLDTNEIVSSATNLTSTSFTPDADLDEGTYRFLVRAVNAAGSSGWAGPFDFEVALPQALAMSSQSQEADLTAPATSKHAASRFEGGGAVLIQTSRVASALSGGGAQDEQRALAAYVSSSPVARLQPSQAQNPANASRAAAEAHAVPNRAHRGDAIAVSLVDEVFAADLWWDGLAAS